ncbi:MAG: hypothetical protein R3C68_05125 [Myxococcota bacterium]
MLTAREPDETQLEAIAQYMVHQIADFQAAMQGIKEITGADGTLPRNVKDLEQWGLKTVFLPGKNSSEYRVLVP